MIRAGPKVGSVPRGTFAAVVPIGPRAPPEGTDRGLAAVRVSRQFRHPAVDTSQPRGGLVLDPHDGFGMRRVEDDRGPVRAGHHPAAGGQFAIVGGHEGQRAKVRAALSRAAWLCGDVPDQPFELFETRNNNAHVQIP